MDKGRAIRASTPGMESGSGEHSYASNSLLQNYNFHTYAKPHLSQALDHLAHHILPHAHTHCASDYHACTDTPSHEHHGSCQPTHPCEGAYLQEVTDSTRMVPSSLASSTHIAPQHHDGRKIVQLKFADFGCSYGRNTLDYAAFIVQGLFERLNNKINTGSYDGVQSATASVELELQYFFSDLPTNDFNALLQSVQTFLEEQRLRCVPSTTWKLFSGAVAGSFYGPLFPAASLNLAISTYALQWLSQVPPEVVDRASPAWNGGHIWIHGSRPMVVEAYSRQFQRDMKVFLQNRAKEMASGGVLFVFFPARSEKCPKGAYLSPHHDIWTGCYEATWQNMVLEGLIREEELDMFNLPTYICHTTEMQEALDNFANEFKVVKMGVLEGCSNVPKEQEREILGDPAVFGSFVRNFVASLMNPIVQEYLGESRAFELFERLQIEAARRAHRSTSLSYDMLIAIIQRL